MADLDVLVIAQVHRIVKFKNVNPDDEERLCDEAEERIADELEVDINDCSCRVSWNLKGENQ